MIGIYLLVALVSFFSPSSIPASFTSGPSHVAVQFEKLNGVKVGAPVLVEGQLIGTVSEISSVDREPTGYVVLVKIEPAHRALIRQGTVGLITSPLSTQRVRPETVIEFLVPTSAAKPLLRDGESIDGFSSLVEFWSSGTSQHLFETT